MLARFLPNSQLHAVHEYLLFSFDYIHSPTWNGVVKYCNQTLVLTTLSAEMQYNSADEAIQAVTRRKYRENTLYLNNWDFVCTSLTSRSWSLTPFSGDGRKPRTILVKTNTIHVTPDIIRSQNKNRGEKKQRRKTEEATWANNELDGWTCILHDSSYRAVNTRLLKTVN